LPEATGTDTSAFSAGASSLIGIRVAGPSSIWTSLVVGVHTGRGGTGGGWGAGISTTAGASVGGGVAGGGSGLLGSSATVTAGPAAAGLDATGVA
jgi:hypothetical protein